MSRTFKILSAFVAAVGGSVLYACPPSQYSFYPRCPIYSTTHLLCPGCGTTRALYELLHLNLRGALHYNALTTLLIPVVFIWGALEWRRAFQQKRPMQLSVPTVAWAALLFIAVVFTIARNTGLAFAL